MLKFQVNFDDPYMARLKRPVEFYWPCHVYGTGRGSTGPGEKILRPSPSCFNKTATTTPRARRFHACGPQSQPRPVPVRQHLRLRCHEQGCPDDPFLAAVTPKPNPRPPSSWSALSRPRHRACAQCRYIYLINNHSSATSRVLNANEHRIMSRHLKHVQRQRRLVLQQAIDRPPGRNPQPTI